MRGCVLDNQLLILATFAEYLTYYRKLSAKLDQVN
jgi:hypothetical protein